jgi:hypothetical protein
MTSKKNLAVVYSGSAQHNRTFSVPKYKKFVDDLLYLPDLQCADLSAYRALMIPTRLHSRMLQAAEPNILRFLANGGTVVSMGDQTHDWLPGTRYEWRETNFWWWLEPDPKSGLAVANPKHSLYEYLTLDDATWHQHGVFWAPPEADVAVGTEDGAAVFYTDAVNAAPGKLVMTTLDPDYHFGAHFMPATERFLDGFFPWLSDQLSQPA